MNLDMIQFAKNNNFEIDRIYIDKFWNNINNQHWLYVDDELINWIGYTNTIASSKQKYINLLKDNFKEYNDFKIYNYDDLQKIFHLSPKIDEMNQEILRYKDKLINTHNRTLHLIISPRCFKKSLMMVRTNRADDIREYYIDIEELCFKYNKFELNNKENELKEEKEKNKLLSDSIINYNILKLTGYVYIATTTRYASENIFKIGFTNKLQSRLGTYNTAKVSKDKYYYCFTYYCHDYKLLEKYIFSFLNNFKVKDSNELYNLHYELLLIIMKNICHNDLNNINMMNDIISHKQNEYQNLPPIIPQSLYNVNEVEMKYNKNNIIQEEIKSNTIQAKDYNHIILKEVNNNIIQEEFKNNIIQEESKSNITQEEFKNNIIQKEVKNNIIQEEDKNIIQEEVKNNTIQEEVKSNTNLDKIKDNIIQEDNKNNTIQEDNNKKTFQCNKCNKIFKTQYVLDKHIRTTTCVHKCEKCGMLFSKYCKLLLHIKRKSDCRIKEYECNKCHLIFNQIHNYNQHINRKIPCTI